MHKGFTRLITGVLVAAVSVLSACTTAAPEGTPTLRPTRPGTLVPYTGPSSTATATPGEPDTATPLPSATPTPRTHTVRKGEDMFGISLRYGVTLDDLMKANPTVDPRFLSIGIVLIVPAAVYTPTPDPNNPPQPTPISIEVRSPDCYPSGDGGLWCFTRADSRQAFGVEGVSVSVRLYDRGSGQIIEQSAFPPLNLLTPGGFLPLAAYFAPPAPGNFDVIAELISALPVPDNSGRYLTLNQSGVRIEIGTDGLSATVSGTLSLAEGDKPASKVDVAAVAFNAAGHIAGLRRWDSNEGLAFGESLPFELQVYSAGPPIVSVRVLTEAVP